MKKIFLNNFNLNFLLFHKFWFFFYCFKKTNKTKFTSWVTQKWFNIFPHIIDPQDSLDKKIKIYRQKTIFFLDDTKINRIIKELYREPQVIIVGDNEWPEEYLQSNFQIIQTFSIKILLMFKTKAKKNFFIKLVVSFILSVLS